MTEELLGAVIGGGAIIMAAALALGGVILGIFFRRLQDLESRIDVLEPDLYASIGFINAIGQWIEGGAKDDARPTLPDRLKSYVTAGPWVRRGSSSRLHSAP